MQKSRIIGTVGAAAITLGTLGSIAAMAGSASAATHPVLSSTTKIVNREDGGGNGIWAHDTMTRVLSLTYLGKSSDPTYAATPFMYTANIKDTGTFLDIPGAFTPNQGGHNLGKHLRVRQISGPMSGVGQFNMFYSSARAHNGLVPTVLRGAALNELYPSSTWPELSFPTGTTFVGVNEAFYDYTYHAVPVTNSKHVIIRFKQNWEDASFNGDGQVQHDGNIAGLR